LPFLNIAAEIPQYNEDILSLIQAQKNKIRELFVEILEPIHREALADELYILFEGALASSKVFKENWTIEATRRIVENCYSFLFKRKTDKSVFKTYFQY